VRIKHPPFIYVRIFAHFQATVKAHPEFPKVPVALNLAKTDEARKLIEVVLRVNGLQPVPICCLLVRRKIAWRSYARHLWTP